MLSEGSFSFFYTLQGWFPGKLKMVTSATELQRIRVNLLAKMHLDGKQARAADPLVGPLATALAVYLLGGPCSYLQGVCLLWTSVWSAKWALLVSMTQDGIFFIVRLHLRRVFHLFHICSTKMARYPI